MGYSPASVKQLQKSLTACFPQRSDFLISTCRDPGCAATEGRGTQTSPPILSVNEFWIQLWLSFVAGTHTKTPDAFLKVAALFKKLSRTGSPSQTTLRFLFLGGFRVLVCQEREMTVLPCASPSTSSCRRALGSLVGQLPVDSTSRGNTHTLYSPMLIFPPLPPKKKEKEKKKKKTKNPLQTSPFLCKALPLHLLLGWSHGRRQVPPHSPVLKGISLKSIASTLTTGSQQLF